MQKALIIIGSISGALAVVLGAMGSHMFKKKISADLFSTYETAVQYHFYHTIAIFIAVWLLDKTINTLPAWSGILFSCGILLFSGSLYLLSLREVLNIENISWLGPVTPFGGLCFITGWVLILVAVIKN